MCEIADVWTEEVSADVYASFLGELDARIVDAATGAPLQASFLRYDMRVPCDGTTRGAVEGVAAFDAATSAIYNTTSASSALSNIQTALQLIT